MTAESAAAVRRAPARSRRAPPATIAPLRRSIRFMPEPSPGSIGASRAGQQRRQIRAHEMDARGRRVRVGLLAGEPADLRAGESLAGRRTGQRGDRVRAAERALDRPALTREWTRPATPAIAIARKSTAAAAPAEQDGSSMRRHRQRVAIEIDAAVLLRRAGDRTDALDVDFGRPREPREHAIERVGPHHRRGIDFACRPRRVSPRRSFRIQESPDRS